MACPRVPASSVVSECRSHEWHFLDCISCDCVSCQAQLPQFRPELGPELEFNMAVKLGHVT